MAGESPRGLANIAHAIAYMKIPVKGNSSAIKIVRFLDDGKTHLFEHGNTQEVANCIWECGKLGIRIAPSVWFA